MSDTSDLQVGQRWLLYGRVREVIALEEYPERGPGLFAAMVPVDRTAAECKTLKTRGRRPVKLGEAAWTDWWLTTAVINRGQLIPEGADVPAPQPKRSTVQKAVDEARAAVSKRPPLTPLRRARNRITSARYKLAHPDKSGRSEWTALEKADIEATIRDAEAEVARLTEKKKGK